jgi:hypothetical protein
LTVEDESYITDTIEKEQLCWYGYSQQMADKRLPEIIMSWVPTKQRRGRPERRWHGRLKIYMIDNA